jgi:hypothetical protein
MSKFSIDILFLIFEELQDNFPSLFSCLMVNRLWCEAVVPILWRNSLSYNIIVYRKRSRSCLFFIISCYLIDDIKEFITEQGIQLPSCSNQSLLFDYFTFCRSINIKVINSIISIGSSLSHNQFFMQQEFYQLFMKKCPEVKYLDMSSIRHQIFYFSEANARLESLCELECDSSIDSSYFYGLSRLCQNIQRLIIFNVNPKPNYGIARLIEVQKKLKHFEWIDDFYDEDLSEDQDPYKEMLFALEKKVHSLNHLRVLFRYVDYVGIALFHKILTKSYKLKILIFEECISFTEEQIEQLRMMTYHELEILNLEWNSINVISSIIENSGGHIKKILFRPYDTINHDYCSFNENSFNLIRKIYENCPSIEYLSIVFPPPKKHFAEFEKLLKICQNLKSLSLIIRNVYKRETNEKILENGKNLLKILISSAPTNLKEIRLYDHFKFPLENFEEFLEKWRGRSALSIFTSDPIYEGKKYKDLIKKYKRDGVIKDFKRLPYEHQIDYLLMDRNIRLI